MIAWLTHLQHARGRNVIFVGILDERTDDFNRKVFAPQIDGSKTGNELPGIVDQVITMAEIKPDPGSEGKPQPASVAWSARRSTPGAFQRRIAPVGST
jgi:hypothetical protein